MLLFWILFNVFALGMLVLDLRVFHRHGHVVHVREALGWGALWIGLAAIFAAIVYFWQGQQPTLEFVTGYVVELSLSVDNLFVFLIIFRYFSVPDEQQYRVLFWGILGALVMRGIFIGLGVGLIHRFHWIIYGFAVVLIYSGIRFAFAGGHKFDPSRNPFLNVVRRIIPISAEYHGSSFFLRERSVWRATPLFLALVMIELTDVVFAADSIPAVLGITQNAFIVYTSNVFAVLGLRSMYFALAGMIRSFRFLHYGLSLVLIFVGVKMLLANYHRIPTSIALCVVIGVLSASVLISVLIPAAEG